MNTLPPFANLFGAARSSVDLRVLTLEKAVNLMHELVVVADPTGRVLSVNPAFIEKAGFTSEEIVGRPLDFLHLPEGGQWVEHSLNLVKAGERWHGVLQVKTKQGQVLELQSSVSAVFDDKKKLAGYVGVGVDKTREQTIARHLQAMHRLESIGTLISGIAHRFNNMLAAIMGHAEILGMVGADNPKVVDRVQKILKSTHQAKEFVAQMSTFSKRGESQKKPTDVVPIVRNAVEFIRAATPRAIQIEANIPDKLPAVMAVSDEINQALLNLFTNALQALENREGGRMELFVEETWQEFPAVISRARGRSVHCIKITLKDNGRGVEDALKPRIFEPFAGQSEVESGSGMGLAIVHGIVLRHEGYIRFDSKVGHGSSFEIFIPIIQKQLTAQSSTLPAASTPSGGERILLVDDEPLITSVGSELLSEMGYQVQAVNHPRAALKLLEQDPQAFDLIITDLTMPEMNGIEMMQRIRALHIAIPAILISGYNERIKADEARACGIGQILSKPCPAQTLIENVRQAIAESNRGIK
jgi:PAS domain S-box-containing protein